MAYKFTQALIIAFCLSFVLACQTKTEIERPVEVWVKRSVLDQQTRMVTLALHRDMYVAYHTDTALPYKIWKGGVYWDGAAFNNIKTIQPQTWGNSYWEEAMNRLAWKIKTADSAIVIQPQFEGYVLKNEAITFNYKITWEGQTIKVTEQPEYVVVEPKKPAFRQVFQTSNVPRNIALYYGDQLLHANTTTTLIKAFDSLENPVFEERKITASPGPFWLDRSGCNTCHEMEGRTIGPSYSEIAARYTSTEENLQLLSEKIKKGGVGNWGEVPMTPHPQLAAEDINRMLKYILSLNPVPQDDNTASRKRKKIEKTLPSPGFGGALEKVHPSFDLQTIRPSWFMPRVGGMDFLSEGTLLIATWDSIGAVYALKGLESGDTNQISIQRIAEGLHEPLGLKVVNDELFVMQKPELTQLIDHDGDGEIDEYKAICNSFGVTNDFHEYAYGLEYKGGFFYVTLGLAMRLMSHEEQHPDRGTALKISKDGQFSTVLKGLRQPNGLGQSAAGDIFITENQGQWVPACKVVVLRDGDFHGCQYGTGDRYADREAVAPAVWLPQDEIGNSPGQPIEVKDGLYQNQLLFGEITHGGIKRVFLEKVNDQWQGAAFRFSQGLEAGINRMVWGPDGALYVGGVGMNGNWAWQGNQYGLQRLVPNGKTAFEMLQIEVTNKGFKITFTQPLAADLALSQKDLLVQQWRYEATENYGGPKLDLVTLKPSQVLISEDRRTVTLTIPGQKEGHVLYFLLDKRIRSAEGQSLWSGEAWYTLNRIPKANKPEI